MKTLDLGVQSHWFQCAYGHRWQGGTQRAKDLARGSTRGPSVLWSVAGTEEYTDPDAELGSGSGSGSPGQENAGESVPRPEPRSVARAPAKGVRRMSRSAINAFVTQGE